MNILEEEPLKFLELLNKNEVKFIIVGGIAVNFYGYSRTTGDIDIWLEDTVGNREKLIHALIEFGVKGAEAFKDYPLVAGFAEILLDEGVYIDFMGSLKAFNQKDFISCYSSAETFLLEEKTPVKFLHINQLIEEKEKSNRPKDKDDLNMLKKIREARK